MKKQSLIAIAFLVASAVLAVVSFVFLPDTVITQFGTNSSDVTTMPKLFAVLIPTALGVGGVAVSLASKNEGDGKKKPLFVSAVGILVFVVMLIVNL